MKNKLPGYFLNLKTYPAAFYPAFDFWEKLPGWPLPGFSWFSGKLPGCGYPAQYFYPAAFYPAFASFFKFYPASFLTRSLLAIFQYTGCKKPTNSAFIRFTKMYTYHCFPPERRISVAFPSWGPFDWLSYILLGSHSPPPRLFFTLKVRAKPYG